MTDRNIGNVGKKRKLPPQSDSISESVSALANSAMGQTNLDGNTTGAGGTDFHRNENNDNVGARVSPSSIEEISYIEFYSGVGGWTMALETALDNLGPLLSTLRSKSTNHDVASKDALHTVGTNESTTNDHSVKQHHQYNGTPVRRYELKRLAALDHSDLCVRVFSHNFIRPKTNGMSSSSEKSSEQSDGTKGKRRRRGEGQTSMEQKSCSIERMPLRRLEEWSADIWVMSPPCQPHTRQHNINNNSENNDHRSVSQTQQAGYSNTRKKDLEDPRSKSFLKICEWLEGPTGDDNDNSSSCSSSSSKKHSRNRRLSDESLPSLIFLENVVGFESSDSFRKWRSALRSRGYRVGHFHLTPTQVRLPNDRPRYYSVAIRGLDGSDDSCLGSERSSMATSARSLLSYLRRETNEDDASAVNIWKAIPELGVAPEHDENAQTSERIAPISSILNGNNNDDDNDANLNELRVPEKVLKNQSAWCFDIVRPSDRRSSCFTHSYGRFVRGTGSILYDDRGAGDVDNAIRLLPPDQREFRADWMDHLDPSKLRYFSGMELVRLFGFSKNFSFPNDTSLKQQWKLMGNSLNVRVASKLIELGFLLRYYHCVDEFGDHTSIDSSEICEK